MNDLAAHLRRALNTYAGGWDNFLSEDQAAEVTEACARAAQDALNHTAHQVSRRAFTEARAGAPAGMVAFYVTVEAEHVRQGHEGNAQKCDPCNDFAVAFRHGFDAARRDGLRVETFGPVLTPPHPAWTVVSTETKEAP